MILIPVLTALLMVLAIIQGVYVMRDSTQGPRLTFAVMVWTGAAITLALALPTSLLVLLHPSLP